MPPSRSRHTTSPAVRPTSWPGSISRLSRPEDLAFDSQRPALVVVEQDSFLSKLIPEYLILSDEVLEGVLLPAIDPAGEDEQQQVPFKSCTEPYQCPGQDT